MMDPELTLDELAEQFNDTKELVMHVLEVVEDVDLQRRVRELLRDAERHLSMMLEHFSASHDDVQLTSRERESEIRKGLTHGDRASYTIQDVIEELEGLEDYSKHVSDVEDAELFDDVLVELEELNDAIRDVMYKYDPAEDDLDDVRLGKY